MKKILFLSTLATLQFLTLFAQREFRGNFKSDDGGMPERLNAVKLNVLALGYKNIALQYERVVGPKISVACQFRYTIKGNLPFASGINNGSSDSFNVFSTARLGGWALTPEFRFYPKHAMKGFYLAPYLRFRNINLDYPVDYIDDFNKPQNITAKGKFNSFGGGLMIGSHFNLGKAMSLDWFIIGFQYLATSGNFKATSTETLSSTDQQDVRNELAEIKKDVDRYVKDFNYSVNSNSFSISSKFGMFGVRGFGLNLGYRF